jgi:hypothetical protein
MFGEAIGKAFMSQKKSIQIIINSTYKFRTEPLFKSFQIFQI